jgi:hypothetical protein
MGIPAVVTSVTATKEVHQSLGRTQIHHKWEGHKFRSCRYAEKAARKHWANYEWEGHEFHSCRYAVENETAL